MSRRTTITSAISLVLGLVAGLLFFRKEAVETLPEGVKREPIPTPAYQMAFREDRLSGEAMAHLMKLKAAATAGEDLMPLFESMDDLSDGEKGMILLELIADLDAEGLVRVYLALEKKSEMLDDMRVSIALFDRLVRLDADRFFAMADRDENLFQKLPMLGIALLASADAEAALERLNKMGNQQTKEAFAMGLAVKSTANAVAWLRENGGKNPDYDRIFEMLLRDPAASFDEVMKIADGESKAEAAHALLEKWALKDGRAAMAALSRLPEGTERDNTEKAVLQAWAEFDPEAAANMAKANAMELDVLESWIRNDPAAAIEWALRNLDGMKKAQFLNDGHSQMSMDQVRSMFQELDESGRQAAFSGDLLERMVIEEPELALATASKMSEGDTGIRLGAALAKKDLQEAMDTVSALSTEEMKRRYALGVALEGGRKDPAGTLAWIDGLGLPNSAGVEKKVFREWAENDPESAMAAARARPGGQEENVAAIAGRWVAEADTEYVFEWVREEMKSVPAVQEIMVKAWLERDPEAGARFLMNNNADGAMTPALNMLIEKSK